MRRVDKTLSELWSLADDGEVGETARMAINTIKDLQNDIRELEKRKEEILVESGKRWTKLLKIQNTLNE